MLTNEDVAKVKEEWIESLSGIKRDFDREGLISCLEGIGFFEAPASTRYNCSFKGGLALHSLDVVKVFKGIVESLGEKGSSICPDESIVILGLLHDVSKACLYEPCAKNEKVYSGYGKKRDEIGTFDWTAVLSYRVKEPTERLCMGSRGFESYMIVSRYLPLTEEETVALCNQVSASDSSSVDVSDAFAKHNLASLLHASDVIASYVVERD